MRGSGRRVGVIGGGQLARMMAQAAIPLDIPMVVLSALGDDAAAQVLPDVIVGSPDAENAIAALAERSNVITLDHELVDPAMLQRIADVGHRVYPRPETLALAQNKRRQHRELGEAGFPVPAYRDVQSLDDMLGFAATHGWPIVAKASRGGYDGRGVWIVETPDAAHATWISANDAGIELLVEQHLRMDLELAVLVARRPAGEIAVYPPVETVQRDGICNEVRVPALAEPHVLATAEHIARRIAEQIDLFGMLAIEFFVVDGEVLINELAPRPHNSGHWTIEGATTSQFEQHLRAVLDLPLGATDLTGPAVATVNILGPADGSDPRDRLGEALAQPGAHVHFYGKHARAGRKLGHVTVVGRNRDDVFRTAKETVSMLTRDAAPGDHS